MRKLRLKRDESLPSWALDWDMPEPGMTRFIYKVVDTVTGEYYIGQHTHSKSCSVGASEYCSYTASGVRIRRAIAKYGVERFTREIIMWCDSQEELDLEETALIDLSNPLCLNLASGGEGLKRGSKWSEEAKQRLKDSGSRKLENNNNWGGASRKADTGAKISAALKASDSRRGEKNGSFGGCKPECTCGRHYKTPEQIAKIKASVRGRKYSEKARMNMSKAAKLREENKRLKLT